MLSPIYYPGFETKSDAWLKFALLYVDTLRPIIPRLGDSKLSETFRKVRAETDLLDPYRPEPDKGESHTATLDAIDHLERILVHPRRYQPIFGLADIVTKWRDPSTWTTEIYDEKFHLDFGQFCVQNRLGRYSSHGIKTSPVLADLYMTILAHAIADANGVSPITDDPLMDSYGIFARRARRNEVRAQRVAKRVLELKIPRNLADIPFDRLIKHRTRAISNCDSKVFMTRWIRS